MKNKLRMFDEDSIPLCLAYYFIEIFPDDDEKVMCIKELKKRGYSLDDIIRGLLEVIEIQDKCHHRSIMTALDYFPNPDDDSNKVTCSECGKIFNMGE